MRALRTRLRPLLAIVNPMGWVLLALGAGFAVAAWLLHWRELAVVAAACLLLVAMAVPFLFGRTRVRVELTLQPERVIAGNAVSAGVRVTNLAGHQLLPTMLELPVGTTVHRYAVSRLGAAESHEETFTIRTERRGVIPVGPASTRRGDPLSICSRDVDWTGVSEILVRPPMVPLDSLGSGLLRDLEGVSTDAVSQSDLAFHALREYTPGDDLRHIHWRSSAKAMGVAGENQLLVRQYLDTRRSHVSIVVDDQPKSWADAEEFEAAMSVAASIVVRATLDEFDTTFVCGKAASTGGSTTTRSLDAVCRADFGAAGLIGSTKRAVEVSPDTSLVFLLAGSAGDFETLQRAAAVFAPEVRRYGVIIDTARRSKVTSVGGMSVVHVQDKLELGALLRWTVR